MNVRKPIDCSAMFPLLDVLIAAEVLAQAMTIGWTQNSVILEAGLTLPEQAWYIRDVRRFGWLGLRRKIALDFVDEICYTEEQNTSTECAADGKNSIYVPWQHLREPMAEFVMKDLVKKAGLESRFQIASAATSTEGIGNPVYPPACRKLAEHGISCAGKTARQLTKTDYTQYALLIGMDRANIRSMNRICGGDPDGKIKLPLNYTDRPGDVADPWYTGDFGAA